MIEIKVVRKDVMNNFGVKKVYPTEFIKISKMFITSFLTTFILMKTLYSQIQKNCVKSKKTITFVSLDNFGGSRRENSAKYEVYHTKIYAV